MFDFVATINDVKKGKPYPEQFLYTARKLKVNPGECLVIGDSIYDALAAKRAGMDFIGILSGYNKKTELIKEGAIKTIHSVNELARLL